MKKPFHAQSTLEFIMILILVLAGILVMGPYVIRSINAYMRSWEISADQAKHNPNVTLQPWELPFCSQRTVDNCCDATDCIGIWGVWKDAQSGICYQYWGGCYENTVTIDWVDWSSGCMRYAWTPVHVNGEHLPLLSGGEIIPCP